MRLIVERPFVLQLWMKRDKFSPKGRSIRGALSVIPQLLVLLILSFLLLDDFLVHNPIEKMNLILLQRSKLVAYTIDSVPVMANNMNAIAGLMPHKAIWWGTY